MILNNPAPAWIQFEYWHWGLGLAFAAAALVTVLLGVKSMAGLGNARKWTAIGARLGVLSLLLAILAGVRWSREHNDLEVVVVRDISRSIRQFRDYPGRSFEESWKDYLTVRGSDSRRQKDDRIGEIVFNERADFDVPMSKAVSFSSAAISDPVAESQTDIAGALELAIAAFRPDVQKRIVMVTDANQTIGNIDPLIARAKSLGIPIDVMPLRYSVGNEVMVDRLATPSWKRENDPVTIEVFVRSANVENVKAKLEVFVDDKPLRVDPDSEPGTKLDVTLTPGLNRFSFSKLKLEQGVHRFKALIDGQKVQTAVQGDKGDSLMDNNVAEGFVVVQGKGRVLYVNNAQDVQGRTTLGNALADKLKSEGIELVTVGPDGLSREMAELQGYDAIIMANVPRNMLTEEQDRMIATYVHDMGGGLIMIGGPEAFGAGGWAGSHTEKVLPVPMDVPAERHIPKGALVLVVHSCEMPNGNYWGEQCALQAANALGSKDDIGVIVYGWGPGGAQWVYPLAEKGDGSKVAAAIKTMQVGDMPSFEESVSLAVNGSAPPAPSLKKSDAQQKHIIIISDGDPQKPSDKTFAELAQHKISISTISVYPHELGNAGVPTTMEEMAVRTRGRFYGPIEKNPSQLPQIFIKEATVVRRSLIVEKESGLPVKRSDGGDQNADTPELLKGLSRIPMVNGMVLTGGKRGHNVEMPLVVGDKNDPLLAYWQAGLGRVVVFTSDATAKWAPNWLGSEDFTRFWAQAVRYVSRPPMSTDFDVRVTQDGNRGKIVVEAKNKESAALSFLNFKGIKVGPDNKPEEIELVQTAAGVYEASVDARRQGNHIAMLSFTGPNKQKGYVMGGFTQNSSPESRELSSNDPLLDRIATATGGRILRPFDRNVNLFARDNMPPARSSRPVWDLVLPFLLALIILDVAIRRIAWDWNSTKRMANSVLIWVKSYTTIRKVEKAEQTLGALKQVRENVAEQKLKSAEPGMIAPPQVPTMAPNPGAKFEARAPVSGDIASVVGGATDKPVPAAPKVKTTPKGERGDTLGGLLAAKKRAQEKMKEQDEQS